MYPRQMIKIFIVVHANSSWNELGLWQGHCDTELSETVQVMANNLANHHNMGSVKQIYASDLKRAWQTAAPLAGKLGLKIIKNIYLREGRWVNHDLHKDIPVLSAPYDYEDRADVRRRATSALNDIVRNSSRFPILIVTHGTFLECFVETISTDTSPLYKGIRTAVNTFEYTEGDWKIIQLNDVSHLPKVTSNMCCVTDKIS